MPEENPTPEPQKPTNVTLKVGGRGKTEESR
jgi:hypothetical protein